MRPDGAEVWVVGSEGYGVVIIETAGRTVTHQIVLNDTFTNYKDVAFGLDGRTAFVSGPFKQVVVLDTLDHSRIGSPITISSADQAIGEMAVNPVNGLLYVLDSFRAQLHVVDPDTHAVSSHTIGTNVSDVAVDSTASTLYVSDAGSDQAHVLNASDLSSVTSIAVGEGPRAIDLTPDGTFLFVVNQYSDDVSVIDTSTNLVEETIDFLWACDPRDIDISADGARAYVTTGNVSGDHGLWVIDVATLTVVDRFGVSTDTYPQAVAVAPEIVTPLVFADRFEVGDTRAWSQSVP